MAASVDDSDYKTDDNASVGMIYRVKAGPNGSRFEIKAEGSSKVRKIPPTQLQIGYKTYGPGYEL